MPPVEPLPTRWALPPAGQADGDGLVGFGADLEPGTLLAAYRSGLFPMPVSGSRHGEPELAWWSPDPRGVLPLTGLRVSHSLRRARRRFDVRVDTEFIAVVEACADPDRPGAWITRAVVDAYVELHRLGWAHSVETWTSDNRLAGGLYGVAIGGLFAGESMFHVRAPWGRDASKVALVALADLVSADGLIGRLIDVQWATPHLRTLGVVDVPRVEYLARLRSALSLPLPAAFSP